MGKKYVIELEDVSFVEDLPFPGERLYRVKGFKSLVFDKVGLSKLKPLDDVLREAERKGQDEAKQEGAEEAWKLARWAFSEASDSELADTFPYEWNNGGYNRIMKLPFAEAMDKYKNWQLYKNKIRVGDEVKVDNLSGVVTMADDEYIVFIGSDGFSYTRLKDKATLTGRHFSEVYELLKKIGEKDAK